VWDPRNRRLPWYATVRGTPLFYARNRNEIIFATEIAALVAHVACRLISINRRCENIFSSESSPHRRRVRRNPEGRARQFIQLISAHAPKSYWRWQIRETPKQRYLSHVRSNIPHAVGRQTDVDVDFVSF